MSIKQRGAVPADPPMMPDEIVRVNDAGGVTSGVAGVWFAMAPKRRGPPCWHRWLPVTKTWDLADSDESWFAWQLYVDRERARAEKAEAEVTALKAEKNEALALLDRANLLDGVREVIDDNHRLVQVSNRQIEAMSDIEHIVSGVPGATTVERVSNLLGECDMLQGVDHPGPCGPCIVCAREERDAAIAQAEAAEALALAAEARAIAATRERDFARSVARLLNGGDVAFARADAAEARAFAAEARALAAERERDFARSEVVSLLDGGAR